MTIKEKASAYFEDTIALRRGFHMYPDMYPALNKGITRTTTVVMNELNQYGIPYEILPDYSILATIDSGKAGKVVLLRADMDALPIQELSSVEYCSQVEGVGHLCGHDCHTASLLTAARILNEERDSFSGKVKCIFQSCEEAGMGAEDIVTYGIMEDVDAVFGTHVFTELRAGTVSVQKGPRMAASMRVKLKVRGKGGHGGQPNHCIDPVVAASAIVMNLQTIASREVSPLDSVAITVGTIHGGTIFTAVADEVELEITVKFFNVDLADNLRESITRISKSTAEVFRASCDVDISGYLRPVINDNELAKIAQVSASKLIGEENVAACKPWSASEDFSEYTRFAPGVFAFIGVRNEERGIINPAHHPGFEVDEKALEVAAGLYAQFAVDYLTN